MRVVVADDHLLIRQGVVAALTALGDVDVVAECATYDDLIETVDRLLPDVVVTDIRMPPTHTDEGIQAARVLRSRHHDLAVVVLSHHADPEYVLSLFDDGSERLGYLLKEHVADLDDLRHAIQVVRAGGSSIDPSVVSVLVGRRTGRADPIDDLSPRERDVLALIAEGFNNAAIAQRLVIAEKSVQKHINTIFSKLHLTEETDAHHRVRAVRMWLART
ncbi:MAG: response regulator transcription factor [Ilumatobacteraceae bacterium]